MRWIECINWIQGGWIFTILIDIVILLVFVDVLFVIQQNIVNELECNHSAVLPYL